MNCRAFGRALADYVGEHAPEDLARRLEEHAAGCPRCAGELRTHRLIESLLIGEAKASPPIRAPARLVEGAIERIEADAQGKPPLGVGLRWGLAFAVLAVAALAAAIVLHTRATPGQRLPALSPMAASGTASPQPLIEPAPSRPAPTPAEVQPPRKHMVAAAPRPRRHARRIASRRAAPEPPEETVLVIFFDTAPAYEEPSWTEKEQAALAPRSSETVAARQTVASALSGPEGIDPHAVISAGTAQAAVQSPAIVAERMAPMRAAPPGPGASAPSPEPNATMFCINAPCEPESTGGGESHADDTPDVALGSTVPDAAGPGVRYCGPVERTTEHVVHG